MTEPQANPFGRTRNEVPSAEELLPTLAREMPHSLDAEKGVLSCWVQFPQLMDSGALPASAFYSDTHRTLASHLLAMHSQGRPVEPLMIMHSLTAQGLLEQAGGASLVSEITTAVTAPAFYGQYRDAVKEAWTLRRHIHAHSRALDMLFRARQSFDGDVSGTMEAIKGVLEEVEYTPGQLLKSRHVKEIIPEIYEGIEYRVQNPGRLPGYSTGIQTLDKRTGGLQQGHVWVLAGAPGDGKSTMMQNAAEAAAAAGAKVRWYPLEMPDTEQVFRLLVSGSQVDNETLFSGSLSRAQMDALTKAQRRLCDMGIEVVDVDGATATDIFADVERSDADVIVVDYLQLLEDPSSKQFSREQIISGISRRMKRLANRTKKCIITGSQLNDDGRLRESRAIGQDADKVFLINKHPLENGEKGETDDTKRLLWCDKNRGGKRHWELPLNFLGHIFQFREIY